jgi:hypothetical protein
LSIPFFTTRIEASRGEVWIPTLSVLVSRMERPVLLRRREVATPELGLYDLHAAVSYFNRALWEDPAYEKTITLFLGKRPLRVRQLSGTNVVLLPGAIRIEGVDVEWLEASAPAR